MPKFAVECVLPKGGGLVSRTVEAPTATIARARLVEQGLFPATPVRLADPLTRYKIKRKVFTRLCHEFAENLSGDPKFIDILKLLREHFDDTKTRRILSEIHDAIANGESSPADAFARYPRSFPPDVIEILRSGFGSGQDALAERFRDLAERLEDAEARKGQFIGAIAYPLFLIAGVLALLTYTFVYFLPKFQPLLASYNAELPAVSQYLFAIGGFTKKYFVLCFCLALGVFFLLSAIYKIPKVRFTVDKLMLSIPLVGRIMRYLITSEVCSNYKTLSKANIDAHKILESCSSIVRNRYARHILDKMRQQVGAQGFGPDDAFISTAHLWAPEAIPSIVTGAQSGRLPEQMAHIAKICNAAAKVKSERFFIILRTGTLLFTGLILGVVVYGLVIPIFTLALNIK